MSSIHLRKRIRSVEPFSFPKDVKHEKIHECFVLNRCDKSPHHFIVQDLEQQPWLLRWDSRANHPWITSFGSSHGWVYSSHGATELLSNYWFCSTFILKLIKSMRNYKIWSYNLPISISDKHHFIWQFTSSNKKIIIFCKSRKLM